MVVSQINGAAKGNRHLEESNTGGCAVKSNIAEGTHETDQWGGEVSSDLG